MRAMHSMQEGDAELPMLRCRVLSHCLQVHVQREILPSPFQLTFALPLCVLRASKHFLPKKKKTGRERASKHRLQFWISSCHWGVLWLLVLSLGVEWNSFYILRKSSASFLQILLEIVLFVEFLPFIEICGISSTPESALNECEVDIRHQMGSICRRRPGCFNNTSYNLLPLRSSMIGSTRLAIFMSYDLWPPHTLRIYSRNMVISWTFMTQ